MLRSLVGPGQKNLSLCGIIAQAKKETPSQVNRIFELAFSKRDTERQYLLSEEELSVDKVKDSIRQIKSSNSEILLLLKTNRVSLPNNKAKRPSSTTEIEKPT